MRTPLKAPSVPQRRGPCFVLYNQRRVPLRHLMYHTRECSLRTSSALSQSRKQHKACIIRRGPCFVAPITGSLKAYSVAQRRGSLKASLVPQRRRPCFVTQKKGSLKGYSVVQKRRPFKAFSVQQRTFKTPSVDKRKS